MNRRFTVEPFRLDQNRDDLWGCSIHPEGSMISYPLREPHATQANGPYVVCSSREEAVSAGHSAIMADFLPMGVLARFMELSKRCEELNPGHPQRLTIPRIALIDWRKLTEESWRQEQWAAPDDPALTSARSSSEEFTQALERQLARVGVRSVVVANDAFYMRVDPL
jgi:hypothetical protein